jgi:hypothetical protein
MQANFTDLLGKTLTSIENKDNDELIFTTTEGEIYIMFHSQDCCEHVRIEDISGDLDNLIGSPITLAEEVSNYEPIYEEDKKRTEEAERWGSCTWTFYKLATVKGYVDIRWYGESNGYYSERVDFHKDNKYY